MESTPKISLCMIVKNEEKRIEQCLRSVHDLVDEIIIVDTGSTDQTVEICKQFGAKIYHYKWEDHFAKARNKGLIHATGEWILWLDADEEMDSQNKKIIKEKICMTKAKILHLPIVNYFGETFPVNRLNAFVYYQPRLFRNDSSIQFENRIHEMPYSRIEKDIAIEHLSTKIHHYGYISEVEKSKEKGERNIRLLEYPEMKEDPWMIYHLASEHYRRQNYIQAFEYVNESIVHFLLQKVKPPSILYRLKYTILIETGSLDGAWPSIEKAIELYPDYVDLHYCKGYILYLKEEYSHALQTFNKCLELGENNYRYLILQGAGSFRALEFKEKCLEQLRENDAKVSTEKKAKNILYVGWIGYNNLGDELMYELFKKQVERLGEEYTLDFVNCEKRYLDHAPYQNFDLIVLGGGSILNGPEVTISPLIIDFLDKMIEAGKGVMMWGTGLDWFSKTTLDALRSGKDDANLEISGEFKSKIANVVSKSLWLGVRGPLTMEVLKRIGVNEQIQVSGDPAFLMQIDEEQLVSNDQRKKTIGVNWGTSFNHVYGAKEEDVEDQLAKALQKWIHQGYRVHLYIVWEKDIEPTKRLFYKLNDCSNVVLDTRMYSYHELISLLRNFLFTINFKLHANYLSLAARTPFIALGYRFKIYDFVYSIGLENQLIDMDSKQICEDLLLLERSINTDRVKIIGKMDTYKKMYARRLMEPFESKLFFS